MLIQFPTGRTIPSVLGNGLAVGVILAATHVAGANFIIAPPEGTEDKMLAREELRRRFRRPIQETINEIGEGRGMALSKCMTMSACANRLVQASTDQGMKRDGRRESSRGTALRCKNRTTNHRDPVVLPLSPVYISTSRGRDRARKGVSRAGGRPNTLNPVTSIGDRSAHRGSSKR
jgi:hypothetical protein